MTNDRFRKIGAVGVAGACLAATSIMGCDTRFANDDALRTTEQKLVTNPKVVAYFPLWTQDDPATLPWDKITHVNAAFAGITTGLTCEFMNNARQVDPALETKAQALINAAPSGVDVLVSIGGWTLTEGFSDAALPENRSAFVNACVTKFITNMGFDGIDLDWEYPTTQGEGNCPAGFICQRSNDAANLTGLLDTFRAHSAMSGKLLTAALRANGATSMYEYGNFFTAPSCYPSTCSATTRFDFVNLMTYDFHGPWESVANNTAPYSNVTGAMNFLATQAGSSHKARMVMGVPFYGPMWSGCSGSSLGSSCTAKGPITYAEAKRLLDAGSCSTQGTAGDQYLYCSGSTSITYINPYTDALVTETLSNIIVGLDTVSDIGAKGDFVDTNNFGGMMYWMHGQDGENALINKIDEKMQGAGGCTPACTGKECGDDGCGGVCGACGTGESCNASQQCESTQTFGPHDIGSTAVTIQSEDYDGGGAGIDHSDTTSGNSGSSYRNDDVDIEAATEGGYDVGWLAAGEWLDYTVNVLETGTYTVEARVASNESGGTFHLELDGKVVNLTASGTGGWQNWQTISSSVNLTSTGQKSMRLVIDSGGYNLNWIKFTKQASQPCDGVEVFQHTAYGGTAVCLPTGNYSTSQLSALGVTNNWVSSLKVKSGMTAVLYDGDNFTGASLTKTADDSDLVNDSWNDLMSSIQVFVGSGGPSCGNSTCETGEDCSSCSADCGSCCGNGTCGTGEDCSTCSADCGACGGSCTYTVWQAGNNYSVNDVVLFTDNNYYVCENENPGYDPTISTWFWDPTTCSGGGGEVCGNGTCASLEDCSSCPTDCGTCGATCGNSSCESGESCSDCSTDCGACPTCSDGIQNQGETNVDCGGPCTACASCSDSIQNQGETGVDCGGPCSACSGGCTSATDGGNVTISNTYTKFCLSPTPSSGSLVANDPNNQLHIKYKLCGGSEQTKDSWGPYLGEVSSSCDYVEIVNNGGPTVFTLAW